MQRIHQGHATRYHTSRDGGKRNIAAPLIRQAPRILRSQWRCHVVTTEPKQSATNSLQHSSYSVRLRTVTGGVYGNLVCDRMSHQNPYTSEGARNTVNHGVSVPLSFRKSVATRPRKRHNITTSCCIISKHAQIASVLRCESRPTWLIRPN